MKVLVTGGSGFLGGHLLEELHARGHETVVMARKTSDLSAVLHSIDEVKYGTLEDLDSMTRACEGVEMVFHCAGAMRIVAPYSELRTANVEGTRKIVKAASECGVGRVIYASSMGVHGMRNEMELPEDKYCRSKAEAEKAFFDQCSIGGIQGVALRPGVIYGPRDYTFSFPMFKLSETGKAFLINGGDTRFPLIYVGDLVDVFIAAMESEEAAGRGFDLAGEEATQRKIMQLIGNRLGVEISATSISYRKAMFAARISELKAALTGYRGEVQISKFVVQLFGIDHPANTGEAEEILGFKPTTTLRDGLGVTADWYRSIES